MLSYTFYPLLIILVHVIYIMNHERKVSRTLKNLQVSDQKFKVNNMYDSAVDQSRFDNTAQNRLINIADMNNVLHSKSLCSVCKQGSLQVNDVCFIGSANYMSVSCN